MTTALPNVTILDDDSMYRRLHHTQVYEDGSVKSIAYMFNSKPDPEVSVDLARLTTPEESVGRRQTRNRLGRNRHARAACARFQR